jgi:hypothetical protein
MTPATVSKNMSLKQSVPVLMGSGDYISKYIKPAIKEALTSIGSTAGSTIGSQVGQAKKGSAIGSMLARKLSRLVGSGDYKTSETTVTNSLFPGAEKKSSSANATFGQSSSGVRIQHREYIEDLISSSSSAGFQISAYSINPGLASTFQWLSQIAQNFEEYIFHGLVFEFVSTTSQFNSNSNMGSVIMSAEYNAFAPEFTTKPQMENSDFAVSARPDNCIMYGVECANNAQSSYYVRSGGSSSQPINLTDLGTFYIALQNVAYALGTSLGEIWVTYDVEFRRPHISPSRFGYLHAVYSFSASTTGSLVGAIQVSFVSYGTLSGAYVASGTSTFVFPNADTGDTYQLTDHIYVNGSPTTLTEPGAPPTVGFTSTAVYASSTGPYTASYIAGSGVGNNSITQYTGTVTAGASSYNIGLLNATIAPSSSGYREIFIVDLGNGFSTTTL